MLTDIRITTIDGSLYDIISEEEYCKKYDLYNNKSIRKSIAVEVNDANTGNNYILPIRNQNDGRPGIYPEGGIYHYVVPDRDNDRFYNADHIEDTNFSNVRSINEFIDKSKQVRDMETASLTDSDDIFIPPISGKETAEMKAMKDAITSKKMDINRYADRFGDNFLNDKRILKGDSITMNKLISISNNMDIEAELILRDAKSDVANPMKKEIRVILTKGGYEDNGD